MQSTSASQTIRILLPILITILVTVSLGRATDQTKPTYKVTGEEATLLGTINFAGIPPKPKQIDMSADPICEAANPESLTEDVVVTDGKLANVMVYVRSGDSLSTHSFEAPAKEVILEHKRCQYLPRVVGMQIQQTLRIVNSDATTHNTHPTPKINRDWNQSQPPGGDPLEKRFEWPELFIPIRDMQHPWERGYVGVFSHPFFSVSEPDGSYKITGLPPGEYTIIAWHEKYGDQAFDLSFGSREQKRLDLTFRASDK